MDEVEAYNALRPRLQALALDPHRMENVAGTGTPDVWYLLGAIEMKWLPRWPARDLTPVTIQTLVDRPGQVAWLMRRWAAGGPAWIMLRVERKYMLFAGCHARMIRRGLVRSDLEALAVWQTLPSGAGDWPRLRHWLLWDANKLPPQEGKVLRRLTEQEKGWG